MFIDRIERLCTTSASRLLVPREYLCLPDFVVIGSDIMEELNCTLFAIDRIYGWNNSNHNYSLCLFQTTNSPAVGVWQNDCLSVYSDVPIGYLRMTYVVKPEKEFNPQASDNSKRYHFVVDISADGLNWERTVSGECGC